ncbi:MAG: 3-hydroxyacyl-ACP dehydratase FabZ [Pseudomonadota bacterium]
MTKENDVLNIEEIFTYLPHRYPMLLVDRVLEVVPNQHIHAIKNVSVNEHFFTGHFPKRPIFPGVLILEALAQASGILAYKTIDEKPTDKSLIYFAGINDARFKRVVLPGDQLTLESKLIRVRREVWKFECIATVEKQMACSATILAARRFSNEKEST